MTKLDEFRAYLSIDRDALDEDIIQQPELFFRVAEAYAQAAADRDALKEELSLVDARLDGFFREKSGDEKITEAKIKGLIVSHKDHETAFFNYSEAKLQADILGALKEAYAQRGHALKDMAQLFITGYYQRTSVNAAADVSADLKYRIRREQFAAAREAKERTKLVE